MICFLLRYVKYNGGGLREDCHTTQHHNSTPVTQTADEMTARFVSVTVNFGRGLVKKKIKKKIIKKYNQRGGSLTSHCVSSHSNGGLDDLESLCTLGAMQGHLQTGVDIPRTHCIQVSQMKVQFCSLKVAFIWKKSKAK